MSGTASSTSPQPRSRVRRTESYEACPWANRWAASACPELFTRTNRCVGRATKTTWRLGVSLAANVLDFDLPAKITCPDHGLAARSMAPRLASTVASASLDGRHDQDLRRSDVELPNWAGLSGPIKPEREPSGREMLGEKGLGKGDCLGTIAVPLGERQVPVSRLSN